MTYYVTVSIMSAINQQNTVIQ